MSDRSRLALRLTHSSLYPLKWSLTRTSAVTVSFRDGSTFTT